MMQAIETSGPGGPEVFFMGQRPIPAPIAGEVLIRVMAAGVNRPDVMQRKGLYPPPLGASDLLGLEVAGEIVGGDLSGGRWRLGDRVCALTPGGGYAEYCVAPATHCLPWPEGYTAVQAAALPETFFTVWANVFQRGRLLPGETFLVHGGSSGIGTTAIQLAHVFGSKVFTTVGSEDKAALCKRLGADSVINYREVDFLDAFLKESDGAGVDVILDMVAGAYLERNVALLAEDGRLVVIALMGGSKAELNMANLMRRRLTITGSTLRPRSIEFKANLARELEAQVWPLLSQGRVAPVITLVCPFADVSIAHSQLESGSHQGKIILELVK